MPSPWPTRGLAAVASLLPRCAWGPNAGSKLSFLSPSKMAPWQWRSQMQTRKTQKKYVVCEHCMKNEETSWVWLHRLKDPAWQACRVCGQAWGPCKSQGNGVHQTDTGDPTETDVAADDEELTAYDHINPLCTRTTFCQPTAGCTVSRPRRPPGISSRRRPWSVSAWANTNKRCTFWRRSRKTRNASKRSPKMLANSQNWGQRP